MAYAKVQATSGSHVSGNAFVTVSFGSLPTVGHLVIVAISSSGPNAVATSVTDNQTGNTYTQVGTSQATPSTGDNIQIFYTVVVGATGTFTVTANFGGTSVGTTMAIHEFSGNATSGSLAVQTASANGTSTAPAVASTTPTNANSLAFSAEVDANGDGTTITAGTSFTIDITQLITSTNERIGTEHWIQTTATATTGAFTLGGSAQWAAKMAIFAPSGTVATPKRLALLGVG